MGTKIPTKLLGKVYFDKPFSQKGITRQVFGSQKGINGQDFGSQKLLPDRNWAIKYHYWTGEPNSCP